MSNRTVRYFEAKGETKKKLAAMLRKRTASLDDLRKWVESHGGHKLAYSEGMGFSAALGMDDDTSEPTNPQLWRRHKNNRRCWVPRQSCKAGKALAAELRKLESTVVSQEQFGQAIKLNIFSEFPYISVPGVFPIGKGIRRILLAIPAEKYEPPKGVELVRISDTTFEKLTKEKRKAEVQA